MNEFKDALRNYANFSGRASQRQYWMYTLVYLGIYFVLMAVAAMLGDSTLGSIFTMLVGLFALALLLPSLAVTIRRLHDTDRSGWFILLSAIPLANLYLLYLLAIRGTDGDNRFGPPPVAPRLNAV